MEQHNIFNIQGNMIDARQSHIQIINAAPGVHVTNHLDTLGADAPSADNNNESEELPTFEEAIPEHLRTGRLFAAWNHLRAAGILDEDYHLAPTTSKAAARYIVECFCQNKSHNEWAPFENFWQIANLRWAKGDFSKEHAEKISSIFRRL